MLATALHFSLSLLVGVFVPRGGERCPWPVAQIDFTKTVLNGLLGFLLFTGVLHIDLAALASRGLLIGVLATVGVLLTTVIVRAGLDADGDVRRGGVLGAGAGGQPSGR